MDMVRIIKEGSIFFDSLTEKIDNYYRGILFISLFFFAFIPSCKDDPIRPPKPEAKLQLTVDDVSCTEAWFSLKTENISFPLDIELMNDSLVLKTYFSINSADTVLYIDSLLPNKSYSFQLVNSSPGIKSNIAAAVTLDTTSHNFTWQTWTFGSIGSSTFFDVAIINENNIWAVGEIMIADTSQNGYTTYNAAHWNGTEWSLHRFMFFTICGQSSLSSYPATSIIVFDENEIIMSAGGRQLIRINGETQVETICAQFSISINKIWGTSKNNLYVVGYSGMIARYYNGNWYKIESGTDLTFQDIFGAINPENGEFEIITTGSEKYNYAGIKLLKIRGSTIEELPIGGLPRSINSIWFIPNRRYLAVGAGIFYQNSLNHEWQPQNSPLIYKNSVRGSGYNDIIVGSAFCQVSHFNGFNWYHYTSELPIQPGQLKSVGIKNNIAICVGERSTQAIIIMGKRN
jgi:hypothetical protein